MSEVEVTTAATSRQLVTLSGVKDGLDITGSGEDTRLTGLIIAASQAMAGPEGLRRQPWLETVEEHLPGPGGIYMILSRWPVQTVTSVYLGDDTDANNLVAAADYEVRGERRDRLYAEDGWAFTRHATYATSSVEDVAPVDYTATYVAGWVMPNQITEWSSGASVTSGEWYSATDADEPFIFQAGGAGTTDSTEPTWPTATAGTVVDNDVTWTAWPLRLPQLLEEMARLQVAAWYRGGLKIPQGIAEEQHEAHRIRYDTAAATSGALMRPVQAVCRSYR